MRGATALEASMTTRKRDDAGNRRYALAHENRPPGVNSRDSKTRRSPISQPPFSSIRTATRLETSGLRQTSRTLDDPGPNPRRRPRSLGRAHGRPAVRETSLKKWERKLLEKKRAHEAEESLARVSDVRAVPAIARVFGRGSEADQLKAVSYVSELIDMVQGPVQYKVQHVQGPGSQGALLIDTPRFTMLRTYDAPPAFSLAESFRGTITYDVDGMPLVIRGVELGRMEVHERREPGRGFWPRSGRDRRSWCSRRTSRPPLLSGGSLADVTDDGAVRQAGGQQVDARILPALAPGGGMLRRPAD